LRDEGVKLMGVCGAVNFLPWLRFWPPTAAKIRWILAGQHRTHQEYERIIRQGLQTSKVFTEGQIFILIRGQIC
jgi:hypothetical protein